MVYRYPEDEIIVRRKRRRWPLRIAALILVAALVAFAVRYPSFF